MYDPQIGRFLQRDPFAGSMTNPLSLNRYAYVQNNPASLLDPIGFYQYRYEWFIGRAHDVGSPEAVMAYFQGHPRQVFPFDLGQCDTIRLGARCDLAPIPFQTAPVQVTAVTSVSFTFTALQGHFDPAGSTITFSIVERRGDVYLVQKAHALRSDEGSPVDRVTAIAAWITWSQQAENLRRAVDPLYRSVGNVRVIA